MSVAACIGCGCDDNHACGDGCYWLRVDRAEGSGVCSECEAHVEAWDRGDRTPRATPVAEIITEQEGTLRFHRPEQPKPSTGCNRDHDWPFEDVRDSDQCRHCGISFVRHVFTEGP